MQLESMIENTLDSLKTVVNSSNIVGQPIMLGGRMIIPITKVTVGYLTGGGEYMQNSDNRHYPYAGGSGGGVNIMPIGLLVCENDDYRFVRINKDDEENKWLQLIESGLKIAQEKRKKQ